MAGGCRCGYGLGLARGSVGELSHGTAGDERDGPSADCCAEMACRVSKIVQGRQLRDSGTLAPLISGNQPAFMEPPRPDHSGLGQPDHIRKIRDRGKTV